MKKYIGSCLIFSTLLANGAFADPSATEQTSPANLKTGFVAGYLGVIRGSNNLATDKAQPILGFNLQFLRNYANTGFIQPFAELNFSKAKVNSTEDTLFPFKPSETIDLFGLGINAGACLFAQGDIRLCPLLGSGTMDMHGLKNDSEFYGYTQMGLRLEVQIPQLSPNLLIMPELDVVTFSQQIDGKRSTETMKTGLLGIGWKI